METNYKNLSSNLSYTQIKKALGVSYFGGVSTSHKLELSEQAGVDSLQICDFWRVSGTYLKNNFTPV